MTATIIVGGLGGWLARLDTEHVVSLRHPAVARVQAEPVQNEVLDLGQTRQIQRLARTIDRIFINDHHATRVVVGGLRRVVMRWLIGLDPAR